MYTVIYLVIFIVLPTSSVYATLTYLSENDTKLCGNSEKTNCIQKCCDKGQYLRFNSTVVECINSSKEYDFTNIPIYGVNADEHIYPINKTANDIFLYIVPIKLDNKETFRNHDLAIAEDFQFKSYLTKTGDVYCGTEDQNSSLVHVSNYCVDYVVTDNDPEETLQIIIATDNSVSITTGPIDNSYAFYCTIVSIVFLALVFLVYIILPERRTFGGMILMGYVFSLLMGFIFLSVMNRPNEPHTGDMCIILTSFIYFFFLSAFCWMFIMSLDIWWTFRGFAKARPIHRRGKRFKFYMYCLFSWGVPFLLTVALNVINFHQAYLKEFIITPEVPNKKCFLDDKATHVYLDIPMAILIFSNWMFFLLTVYNIRRQLRGTEILNSDSAATGSPVAHRHQKNRFKIYLKLAVIMGINWLSELLSGVLETSWLTVVLDFHTLLTGLGLFVVLICKKKIYMRLKMRFRELLEFLAGKQNALHTRNESSTRESSCQETSRQISFIPQLERGDSDLKKPNKDII